MNRNSNIAAPNFDGQLKPIYRRVMPNPQLRCVVRGFSARRIGFETTFRPYGFPGFDLPARPDQFIEFYFAEPYSVSQYGGAPSCAPEIALVAPHSRPGKRLLINGQTDNFTIHFMPSGLHRLFRQELSGLADQAVHAADLLKGAVTDLRDQLARAPHFNERVAVAEAFLGSVLATARGQDGVDRAMEDLMRSGGNMSLAALAYRAGLSERQFNRTFIRRSGLSPRLYGRLVRFHTLLAAQDRRPQERLTDLACEAGYYDQAHFIRDCHAFTGQAPRAYLDGAPKKETGGRFVQFSGLPCV